MDNNYLWEIFTNNKQNISEDLDDDHHHHLLQIPNFQLNGFSQQDNKDLIEDHVGSSVITSQFQTSCDQLYKSSTVNRSTSIITPQFQTSSNCLYKSLISTRSTSIIAPKFQTGCDRLYKSSVNKSTTIIAPGQLQTSCDPLYNSSIDAESTNLDSTKEGLRSDESNKLKKLVHRNIERHRRQDMAKLVTSLRSLIPIEFIKGKRSASDHMHEAVNYIKYLQKNIQELDNTRKNIKNIISLDDQNKSSKIINFQQNNNCVKVNKCEDGMEILINVNNSHKEEIFSLSKVLRWLHEEGLNVVTCDNSKQEEWTFIRIQCQVSDISSGLTVVGLQKKLTDVVN
ncbi:transcription factor bHLH120-like [Solanum dulcamara]|uniref:transcription factor bHLH120-like n=1 Tax=Solanum dulcamara TaxID=45834 RepID=UPI00248545C3|nr:transcription factor bHLH120-like [Solanum dulcamara]